MDAYELQEKLFKAWQELANKSNAGSIKKDLGKVEVYVDWPPRKVRGLRVEDGKIILETP